MDSWKSDSQKFANLPLRVTPHCRLLVDRQNYFCEIDSRHRGFMKSFKAAFRSKQEESSCQRQPSDHQGESRFTLHTASSKVSAQAVILKFACLNQRGAPSFRVWWAGALRQGAVHFSIEIKSSIGGWAPATSRTPHHIRRQLPRAEILRSFAPSTGEGVPPYMVRNGVVKPRTSGTLAPTYSAADSS